MTEHDHDDDYTDDDVEALFGSDTFDASPAQLAIAAAVAAIMVGAIGFGLGRIGGDPAPPKATTTTPTTEATEAALITTMTSVIEAPATTTTAAQPTTVPTSSDIQASPATVPATSREVAVALVPLEINGTTYPTGHRFAVIGPEPDGRIRILAPATSPDAAAWIDAEAVTIEPMPWTIMVDREAGTVTVAEAGTARWVEPVTVGPACSEMAAGTYFLGPAGVASPPPVARIAGWHGLGFHPDSIPLGCFTVAAHTASAWAAYVPAGALVALD